MVQCFEVQFMTVLQFHSKDCSDLAFLVTLSLI